MGLNIKNEEAEELAAEVARLSGQSMTAAVTEALRELRERLLRQRDKQRRLADVREFLELEVWSTPTRPLSKEEEDDVLGFGEGEV